MYIENFFFVKKFFLKSVDNIHIVWYWQNDNLALRKMMYEKERTKQCMNIKKVPSDGSFLWSFDFVQQNL
jgi:hypothetical protein